MTDIADLQAAIADEVRVREEKEEEMKETQKRKCMTNWVVLVGLLLLVVGGMPWRRVKTWRGAGAVAASQAGLVITRRRLTDLRVVEQISLGLAVLTGVFSYQNTILAGIGVLGGLLAAFPVTPFVNEGDVAQAAGALLASTLSRVTWSFYRDLYTVFAAHSNGNASCCYGAVSVALLVQLLASLGAAHLLMTAISSLLASPSPAFNATFARTRAAVPNITLLTLVCFLAIASVALHHNFPGKPSWFW